MMTVMMVILSEIVLGTISSSRRYIQSFEFNITAECADSLHVYQGTINKLRQIRFLMLFFHTIIEQQLSLIDLERLSSKFYWT